jgi:hypothetical protein
VPHKPDWPLSEASAEAAFRLADHLGAIAFDREQKLIIGANWDSLVLSILRTDGTLVEQIPRDHLVQGEPGWAMAVQDWKSVGAGQILAGCIDKSPTRDASLSNAVIELLDIRQRRRLAQVRLPAPEEGAGPVTREGLAVSGDRLFLLPGDLGSHVAIYRYRWKR